MKLYKISNKIYHVQFNSQSNLSLTFLRFQEYYESPKFKGKIFSLDKFKDWYIKNSSKNKNIEKINYYKDWEAFNIPSYILKPFYKGKFNPLSQEEEKLLELLKNIKEKKFYVIGTLKKRNKKDIKHEIAHGLFYTNNKYRRNVKKILKKIDKEEKNKIINLLIKIEGYSKKVLEDELHAYILADLAWLRRNRMKITKLKNIHQMLDQNFNKFYKK